MAKIFIKTFGCALNNSDSEVMAGILAKEGHEIVGEGADVVVINSCTVKNEAESKLYREISKHKGKKIIVAGCVAQAERSLIETKLKDYSVIGTSQIKSIGLVVEQTLNGNRVVLLDKENKRLNLPKIRKNAVVEIIPISEGCLGSCAYCKVRFARGSLHSYDKDEIIVQAKEAVNEGVKEIWLTSQDTGAYGKDMGITLPNLLKDLIKINGDFKIRLGMCNPNYALEYLDELVEILKSDKMYKFIHIPLQSGNNRILKLMNRKYSKKDFVKVFKTLKEKVPNITIATDVICGFPTETEEEFEETFELMKELKPDIINIARFWKRPGTPAAEMKQLNPEIIKSRSKRMMEAFKKISLYNNKKWIGWGGDVVITERGKNNTLIARNFSYKPVIVKDDGQKLGDNVNVKVIGATTWDLRA